MLSAPPLKSLSTWKFWTSPCAKRFITTQSILVCDLPAKCVGTGCPVSQGLRANPSPFERPCLCARQRWSDCVAVPPGALPARSQRHNGTGTGIQEPLVCGRHSQLTVQEETKHCLFFVPTRNPRDNTLSRVLQDLKVLPRFFTLPSIGSTNWEQAVRCPRDGAHSSMLGLALSLRHWWSPHTAPRSLLQISKLIDITLPRCCAPKL